jgi:hypothetical protein
MMQAHNETSSPTFAFNDCGHLHNKAAPWDAAYVLNFKATKLALNGA